MRWYLLIVIVLFWYWGGNFFFLEIDDGVVWNLVLWLIGGNMGLLV